MNQELQLGKYEFYPYEINDEREKLLRELELLSLSEKERETKLKAIRRKLAKIYDSVNTTDSLFPH